MAVVFFWGGGVFGIGVLVAKNTFKWHFLFWGGVYRLVAEMLWSLNNNTLETLILTLMTEILCQEA